MRKAKLNFKKIFCFVRSLMAHAPGSTKMSSINRRVTKANQISSGACTVCKQVKVARGFSLIN